MYLTTTQESYNDVRTSDNTFNFDIELDGFPMYEGSSIDDDRAFSFSSDISEITFGNLLSETSPTSLFENDNQRSFSNLSDCNKHTFENLISNKSVTIVTDDPKNHVIESSDVIPDHDTRSMVAFLELSRHKGSLVESSPSKVR